MLCVGLTNGKAQIPRPGSMGGGSGKYPIPHLDVGGAEGNESSN